MLLTVNTIWLCNYGSAQSGVDTAHRQVMASLMGAMSAGNDYTSVWLPLISPVVAPAMLVTRTDLDSAAGLGHYRQRCWCGAGSREVPRIQTRPGHDEKFNQTAMDDSRRDLHGRQHVVRSPEYRGVSRSQY